MQTFESTFVMMGLPGASRVRSPPARRVPRCTTCSSIARYQIAARPPSHPFVSFGHGALSGLLHAQFNSWLSLCTARSGILTHSATPRSPRPPPFRAATWKRTATGRCAAPQPSRRVPSRRSATGKLPLGACWSEVWIRDRGRWALMAKGRRREPSIAPSVEALAHAAASRLDTPVRFGQQRG